MSTLWALHLARGQRACAGGVFHFTDALQPCVGSSCRPEGSRAAGGGGQDKEQPAPPAALPCCGPGCTWPSPRVTVSGSSLSAACQPGTSEKWRDPAGQLGAGVGVSWSSAVAFSQGPQRSLCRLEAVVAQQLLTQGPMCRVCPDGHLCLTAS